MGISLEEIPHIFECLHSGSQQSSTSGLGLYLSRPIIDAHQGTIAVTSTLEQGSIFYVRLPVPKDR